MGRSGFTEAGYAIHPAVIGEPELEGLRSEAERVAALAGSACVRHLRSRSALFAGLAMDDRIRTFLPPGLVPVRSLLFDKTPGENWPVPWHQDLTLAVAERVESEGFGPWSVKDGIPHVQPPVEILFRMVTARLHLDDATEENGALKVAPGSHRLGRIPPEATREVVAGGSVTCECRAGDLLLMSPLLLHASGRSQHPAHRRIVHFEFAPPDALPSALRWHEFP